MSTSFGTDKPLIYLASPYTHKEKRVEEQRFSQICWVAGMLIERGHHIFCPIAMAHSIKMRCGLTGKFDYWEEFDKRMIDACDELWVVMIKGWLTSVGVAAEIEYAHKLGYVIRYVDPDTLEIDSEVK